jgi:hypothetical protein
MEKEGDGKEEGRERGRETYLQAAQVDLPRRAAFLEAAVRRTERWRRRRAGRARAWRVGLVQEGRSGKLNFRPACRRSPPE